MITSILTIAGGVVVMSGCGVAGAAVLKFLNTFELNVPTKLGNKKNSNPNRNMGKGRNQIEQGRNRIGNPSRSYPSSFGEE